MTTTTEELPRDTRRDYYDTIETLLKLVSPSTLSAESLARYEEIKEEHSWDGLSCYCGGGWLVGHRDGCPEAADRLEAPGTSPTALELRTHATDIRLAKGDGELSDTDRRTISLLHRAANAADGIGASPTKPEGDGWQALADVAAERERQKSAEGWTPAHDDTHKAGELAQAAAAYAFYCTEAENGQPTAVELWPTSWSEDWWKASDDARRNLVKAGALIVAEIERLDRASTDGSAKE